MPICRRGGRYRLVWPNAENGEYIVKIGYHTLKNEERVVKIEKIQGHIM